MIPNAKELLGLGHPAARDRGAAQPLAADRFKKVLHRERMRSDRSGIPFALLVISSHGGRPATGAVGRGASENSPAAGGPSPAGGPAAPRDGGLAALAEVAPLLCERIRETDVAGYLDDERLAVLLPDTACAGAQTLAGAIRGRLPHDAGLNYEVLLYPSEPRRPAPRPPAADQTRESPPGRPVEPLFVEPLPVWKRLIDVIASAVGLLVLAPLLLFVAVLVKLTSPGPAFFSQWRAGLGGRPFRLYKFRTMCADAERQQGGLQPYNEQDGPAFKIANDPRVTPLGVYLRRTCIDELPQLFNVLRGEMTLVGPRPLPCGESDQCRAWERRRLDVTPGLTCFWQVSGSRSDFAEWMRQDIRYIKARRLCVDLRLLWSTFIKVVLHRASY